MRKTQKCPHHSSASNSPLAPNPTNNSLQDKHCRTAPVISVTACLQLYTHSHTLRSASDPLNLHIHRTRLPIVALDSFKSNLKTFLFRNYRPAMFSVPCCCLSPPLSLLPVLSCVKFCIVSMFVCAGACVCACACVRACVRACVSACVCVCVSVLCCSTPTAINVKLKFCIALSRLQVYCCHRPP